MAYDLTRVNLPRLRGTPLTIFAKAARSPVVGPVLRQQMADAAGFEALRAARPDAPLAFGPVLHPRERDLPPTSLDAFARDDAPGPAPFVTADALTAAYRDGTVTPVDVAERVIAHHEAQRAHRPPLRHFIAADFDDIRRQAGLSADRYAQKKPLSPLDGVMVPVKDELHQTPYPTTVGTCFLGDAPAPFDATVVARLRALGCVLVGKTNMHELGIGITGINPHHGAPRNPYDLARFTGGSSSGTAAAVAAGFGPFGVGADGGGSIRIPAALCGLVGLKPTFTRVSEHGAAPLCWSVAHVGPLAATARDCAWGYLAMAGPDENDPATLDNPPVALAPEPAAVVEGLRIGVFRPWFDDADPDVVAACQRTLDGFVERGATVVEVEIPSLNLVRLGHLVSIAVEMATSQMAHRDRFSQYAGDTQLNLILAEGLPSTDYVQAQRIRSQACAWLDDILHTVDVVATPSTGCTAGPIHAGAEAVGESDLSLLEAVMRFAVLANFTGLPAISMPAGYDKDGLPIGFQLLGRAFEEDVLLACAAVAETFVERRAPVWHRPLLG